MKILYPCSVIWDRMPYLVVWSRIGCLILAVWPSMRCPLLAMWTGVEITSRNSNPVKECGEHLIWEKGYKEVIKCVEDFCEIKYEKWVL